MEAIKNTGSIAVCEEELSRAHLYRLLSGVLGSPANQEMLTFLKCLEGDDSPLGQGLAALAEVSAGFSLQEASQEYHDLFIGVTQGELLPYGSHYLTGFLNEKPLASLRADMETLGIERSEQSKEPEDHIASLLEIMSGMIVGDYGKVIPISQQFQFFGKHIETWAGQFFKDLEGAKYARMFMPVGLIGRLFMEIEGEAFKIAA